MSKRALAEYVMGGAMGVALACSCIAGLAFHNGDIGVGLTLLAVFALCMVVAFKADTWTDEPAPEPFWPSEPRTFTVRHRERPAPPAVEAGEGPSWTSGTEAAGRHHRSRSTASS